MRPPPGSRCSCGSEELYLLARDPNVVWACTPCGNILWGLFGSLPEKGLLALPEKPKGATCKGNGCVAPHAPWGEANQPDGSFLCYSCRTTPYYATGVDEDY